MLQGEGEKRFNTVEEAKTAAEDALNNLLAGDTVGEFDRHVFSLMVIRYRADGRYSWFKSGRAPKGSVKVSDFYGGKDQDSEWFDMNRYALLINSADEAKAVAERAMRSIGDDEGSLGYFVVRFGKDEVYGWPEGRYGWVDADKGVPKGAVEVSRFVGGRWKDLQTCERQPKPSTYDRERWIWARAPYEEPDGPIEPGKWLVFVSEDDVDEVWEKIERTTEVGLLGGSAKVSTAYPSDYDPSKRVICVYCNASWDEGEVMRIREELRELGIVGKIPYKTDAATRAGRYADKGYRKISDYYA